MRTTPKRESPKQESEELGWRGMLAVVAHLLPHKPKPLKRALLMVFIFTGSTNTNQDNPQALLLKIWPPWPLRGDLEAKQEERLWSMCMKETNNFSIIFQFSYHDVTIILFTQILWDNVLMKKFQHTAHGSIEDGMLSVVLDVRDQLLLVTACVLKQCSDTTSVTSPVPTLVVSFPSSRGLTTLEGSAKAVCAARETVVLAPKP